MWASPPRFPKNPISSSSEIQKEGDVPITLSLLVFGAVLMIAGMACLSVAAALICGGGLIMAGTVAFAAAQDRAAQDRAAQATPHEAVE